jgi:hypothetical protein
LVVVEIGALHRWETCTSIVVARSRQIIIPAI